MRVAANLRSKKKCDLIHDLSKRLEGTINSQTMVSPEDQKVTFVELFFDLVFVFSITQVVGLLHHGLDWHAVGQAVVVFWLVWWAWTQFTWTLNAADTTDPRIQLGVLLTTAVAFFMAVAVPDAFHGRALWFAATYVLVRVIGLAIYAWVASADPGQRAAVKIFSLVSSGGLLVVLLGGIIGGTAQIWMWGLAILLDIVAAIVGGKSEDWNLHPEHFGERHGLIVIIALGETLIVAAGGVMEASWSGELMAVTLLIVAIICSFWLSYFPRAKPALDEALAATSGLKQSEMARDVFSLIHFVMLCGVIAYALAVEKVLAHPGEHLALDARIALAASMVLFVGGMSIAVWRATRRVLGWRIVLTIGPAIGIVALNEVSSLLSLLVVFASIVTIAALEENLARSRTGTGAKI